MEKEEIEKTENGKCSDECCVCFTVTEHLTHCGHRVCLECLSRLNSEKCPMCRKHLFVSTTTVIVFTGETPRHRPRNRCFMVVSKCILHVKNHFIIYECVIVILLFFGVFLPVVYLLSLSKSPINIVAYLVIALLLFLIVCVFANTLFKSFVATYDIQQNIHDGNDVVTSSWRRVRGRNGVLPLFVNIFFVNRPAPISPEPLEQLQRNLSNSDIVVPQILYEYDTENGLSDIHRVR